MATNLKLATSVRTLERQALASAIERHAAARAHSERVEAARQKCDDQLYCEDGLLRIVERAEKVLAEAKTREARHLTLVALGEASEDSDPVALAQHAIDEAKAKLASARKTRDVLVAEAAVAVTECDSTKDEIDNRVMAVFAAEAATTIAMTMREASALREQLGAKLSLISFLRDAAFDPWSDREQRAPADNFLAAPLVEQVGPAIEPWFRAKETLRTDADAPLPA